MLQLTPHFGGCPGVDSKALLALDHAWCHCLPGGGILAPVALVV